MNRDSFNPLMKWGIVNQKTNIFFSQGDSTVVLSLTFKFSLIFSEKRASLWNEPLSILAYSQFLLTFIPKK